MRKKFAIAGALLLILVVVLIVVFKPHPVATIDSFKECANAGFPVSDTNPPTCNDGRQTFVGPLASAAPEALPVQTLDFSILVEGDSKGNYPARSQLLTTQAQWQTFWAQVHSGLPTQPPLIPVDFSKFSVIAITAGVEPTSGYSVSMLSLQMIGSKVQADVQYRQPGKNCKLPTLKTNPYFIAQVPKLSATPSFNNETVARSCST